MSAWFWALRLGWCGVAATEGLARFHRLWRRGDASLGLPIIPQGAAPEGLGRLGLWMRLETGARGHGGVASCHPFSTWDRITTRDTQRMQHIIMVRSALDVALVVVNKVPSLGS